jgi:D-glycero-D-manno-heptose 1,7-bisphosphate phosphatase
MTADSHPGRVVILDRDGTIVVDKDYLDDPAGLVFLPGAAEALRWLWERGFRLVVITNQSGVARGRFDLQRLEEIHRRLNEMVALAGARLEGIYFCPHGPDDGCPCRKPRTGLLEQAARELGFDLSSVIVVGDKESDIELGRRVGAPTILIADANAPAPGATAASFVVSDLCAAARVIATHNSARGA